jgi:hypothetical protein
VQEESSLLLHSADPFERLALHGLASYYRLHSLSAETPSGKAVRIVRRSPPAVSSAMFTPAHAAAATPDPLTAATWALLRILSAPLHPTQRSAA